MPIDFAADMHVFFAADEFGEAVKVDGVDGEIVGIWDRPTDAVDLGQGQAIVPTNLLSIPVASLLEPAGAALTIVRTGERFVIVGVPRLSRDGSIWSCELDPA
ncbi:hypothetical protein [uncultured Sphingomonas sp.]|uniref:head-tail joining protein n=1 Tax=uncultured Sphingomonas sp. TaxID=158754 RepID=UPI00260029F6|nr:hypothetical protein [uncultured Sphingomonas sp.]